MGNAAESLVRELLASLEEFDPDHMVSFFADDALLVDGPRQVERRGIEAIREEFEEQKAMIGGANVDVKALVSDGKTVMVERVDTVAVGEHRIAMDVVGVFEVDDAGKVRRWKEYYDLQGTAGAFAAALGDQA